MVLIIVNLTGGIFNIFHGTPWIGGVGLFFAGLGVGWTVGNQIIKGYQRIVDDQQDFIDNQLSDITALVQTAHMERMANHKESQTKVQH